MKRLVVGGVALLGAVLLLPMGAVTVIASVASGSSAALAGGSGGAVSAGVIPPAYRAAITVAAAACLGVPALVLTAQLKVESGFDPRAVSPAGAQGIAQFMPGTWAAYGVDANGDGSADPFDPFDGILSAARYDCALRSTLSSVSGDPIALMLAAYNAGPAAVRRYQGVPPYAETQRYVAAILAQAAAWGSALPVAWGPAATAIAFAVSQIGVPYQWGGTGNPGYDCSGLTQAAWAAAGVSIPRTAAQQWLTGSRVPLGLVQPGDLVFFEPDDRGLPHHVGVYMGGGQMVEAPHTGTVVRYGSVNRSDYLGAVRVATD